MDAKKHISLRFRALSGFEDLTALLNHVAFNLNGKTEALIRLEDLTWCLDNMDKDFMYYSFEIPKKNGGRRLITAPCARLKKVLRALNKLLISIYEADDSSHGFEVGKSIASNAAVHVGANYVYNLDLSDFFGTIDYQRVKLGLRDLSNKVISVKHEQSIELGWPKFMDRYKEELIINGVWGDGNPNEVLNSFMKLREFRGIDFDFVFLGKVRGSERYVVLLGNEQSKFKYSSTTISHIIHNSLFIERHNRLLNAIAELCTHKVLKGEIMQRVLPQGAPTSPVLSNMVAAKLDLDLKRLARKYNLRYTRYADDITFSSAYNAYCSDGDFILSLKMAISRNGFAINDAKSRLQSRHHRQEVTGLNVNSKVSIRKSKLKQVRMWLNLIERYGYERASSHFSEHRKIELFLFLRGYLAYMVMIYGKESNKVVSLRKRLFAVSCEKYIS